MKNVLWLLTEKYATKQSKWGRALDIKPVSVLSYLL